MTTYTPSHPQQLADNHWSARAAKLIAQTPTATKATIAFVTSLVASVLGVLGLAAFVVAGFIVCNVLGFVVLGVVLLLLDKAAKSNADSRARGGYDERA